MASRPCLVCGTPSSNSRCELHRNRYTNSRSLGLDRTHDRITKQVIEQWVMAHGWVCPGWERDAHEVPQGALSGDHIKPRSTHPELMHEPSNYAVLCRPCNSRKGNRTTPAQ